MAAASESAVSPAIHLLFTANHYKGILANFKISCPEAAGIFQGRALALTGGILLSGSVKRAFMRHSTNDCIPGANENAGACMHVILVQ